MNSPYSYVDRRNEELSANQAYAVWYFTGDPDLPKKFYRCFGRTSLNTAIEFHEQRGDEFYVQIAVSESPY